jgi:hypothetical protein
MSTLVKSLHRRLSIVIGLSALASVLALLGWELMPSFFPPHAHAVLGALPLALIAFSYLAHQVHLRPKPKESIKAILLAAAFFLWAANQLWPDLPLATACNDMAIALFVLDVFLTIVGWPSASRRA